MDIITNSNKSRYETKQIDLLLPIDTMETNEDVYCSFVPDKIVLRNIFYDNKSTDGDNIFLMRSDLFNSSSRYSVALHKDLKFQNSNLTFLNVQNINQTFNFIFKGINNDTSHDSAIHIVLQVEFIKN